MTVSHLSNDEMDKEMAYMAKEMKRLDKEVAGLVKIETYGAMQRELDLTRTERFLLTAVAVRTFIPATKIENKTSKPKCKILGS